MGNPVYDALSDVQEDLRLILYDVRGNTHDIAVGNPRLKEALRKASKVNDPILSNPLPSPLQGSFEIGVGTRLHTGALAPSPDTECRVSTVSARNVEIDVKHAREVDKSSAGAPRKSGGKGGADKKGRSGVDEGSEPGEGRESRKLATVTNFEWQVMEVGDPDEDEDPDDLASDYEDLASDHEDDHDDVDDRDDEADSNDEDDQQGGIKKVVKKEQECASGKSKGKGADSETDEDPDEETGLWGDVDGGEFAHLGRAFDVKESAYDTWAAAFATVIGELEEEGHLTLQKKRRKLAKALPPTVVDERFDDVRKWTTAGVKPTDMFKLLKMHYDGLCLAKDEKKKVYNAIKKIQNELYSTPEDGANFLAKLEAEPGMFVKRTFDSLGRIVDVFWATVDQQDKMAATGCMQMDTTVFTDRYGCPLLFIVGVDDENRTCVLGQGVLRSESTETFKWFLDSYEEAAGGRRPKVMLTDADQAMAAALREWKTIVHLWYLWHLNKDVVKHCSSFFSDPRTREKMLRLFRNAAYAATPEVMLTDADQAMAAALREWKTIVHLWYLWHLNKDVVKHCSSFFSDPRTREKMLRLFRNAAYAATPEAFAAYRADLERTVATSTSGTFSTKWAFSCRPTALTLGMVATKRTEGMFGVAKKSGIHKKLSLCALWDRLQHVYQTMDIEHGSQYCQLEAKDELGGSQSYDVEVICVGAADDEGHPVPLEGDVLRQQLEAAHFDFNLCEEGPPDTDLEIDCKLDPEAESTEDNTVWARTSLEALLDLFSRVPVHLAAAVPYKLTPSRPGHVVVSGPGGFYLCSCLKLMRHGLPCRHYFAVLFRFVGGKFGGVLLNHEFDGNSVHTRWRQSPDGSHAPWTASRVLEGAGQGDGWDGCDHGQDDNFWGPTYDDDGGEGGVHPAERAAKAAADRSASDHRRVFATLMARNKENVTEIMKTVPHAKASEIQAELDKWVRFQLAEATGEKKSGNPAQVKAKGRPKISKSEGSKTSLVLGLEQRPVGLPKRKRRGVRHVVPSNRSTAGTHG
ncbi:unnamed protein product [Ectocarpus sp. CCAP 1310/34]|nr:unnamed protein product [Ectocarpus sp. CCAP 1310/34]